MTWNNTSPTLTNSIAADIADILENFQHSHDASGNVDTVSQPCARAYLDTAAQVVGSGADTKINLNAESFDTGSDFDSTVNYRFDVPSDGKYLVTGTVRFENIADGKFGVSQIFVDGSAVATARAMSSVADGDLEVCVTDIIDLSAGSYVELYAYHNHGANRDVTYGSTNTFMAVTKLM